MWSPIPVFAPRFSVTVVSGEGVFLVGENESRALSGNLVEEVASLLDGRRSVDDIVAALPKASAEDVTSLLGQLFQEGVLVDATPGLTPEVAAFWSELGVNLSELPRLLEAMPVMVRSVRPLWQQQLEAQLSSFGVRVVAEGRFLIAVVDDYLDPILLEINSYCRELGIPWLAVKPAGVNVWLGPLLIPDETACWQCFRTRLLRNRQTEHFLFERTGKLPARLAPATIPAISDVALAMISLQVVRFVTSHGPSPLLAKLVVQRMLHQEQTEHLVQRLPQCSVCGDVGLGCVTTGAIEFEDVEKHAAVSDGGERAAMPEQTFQSLQHLISPLSGVVKELRPGAWNARSPMKTFLAGHNFALSRGWHGMASSLRANSAGKGKSETQARTSALCEALERYSGRFLGEEHSIAASLTELGADGVHPNRCMLFSAQQYAERDRINGAGGSFTYVPKPFCEDAELSWSPLYSVTHDSVRYLPTSFLFYGYPDAFEELTSFADSNGAASGTTFTDAALQGLFEVVERDAVAIWWYNQLPRPAVDLASFADPYVEELEAFLRLQGREFWVIDITHDVGVPVFVALSRRLDSPREDIVFGFGAHLNARIAVFRAIAEMTQFLPAVLDRDGRGRTVYQHQDPDAMRFWQTATVTTQPFLFPLAGETRSADDYEDATGLSLRQQLRTGIERLEALGLEVLVQNQTRVDIGLPVARVVVPGLRHFWQRLAPGRLYDVPVALGWQQLPSTEADLNPIPMFV